MGGLRSLRSLSPARIAAGYFVFGFCWIPVTDFAIGALFASQSGPTMVALTKGWTFVGISTVLIFVLGYLYQGQMQSTRGQLETTNQQLQVLHRVFRHNIRNDLNVIQGYTEAVADAVTDDRQQEQLELVSETSAELLEISEKLKVIDRVDPTDTEPDPIDAAAVVETEASTVSERYPAADIAIEGSETVAMRAGESVQFAIREAIENAIVHFDGPAEACEIRIDVERTSDAVEIAVSDNGPGIPSEELRAIRSQRETPLVHSSSIGLWLVSWLAQLNDGRVTFESEEGAGTTLTFEFQPASAEGFGFLNGGSALLPAEASAD